MNIQTYFIASEKNNYQPWIMSRQALALICLILWGLKFIIPTQIAFAAAGIDAYDLMARINAERTGRFIPALTTNSKLSSAAQSKASDMIARSYFSHVDPDGNYVWPKITAAGYGPYLALGENLAMDFSSASATVEAWMNSPTHRANIVNENFQDQGLASVGGIYAPGHDTIMTVSLFGTLQNQPKPAPEPEPAAEPEPVSTPAPPSSPAAPAAKPAPQPTAPAKPKPEATPAPLPLPEPVVSLPDVTIYEDIKLTTAILPEQIQVNVDVIIKGQPVLVTAQLKSQSIHLTATETKGQYLGMFTFDPSETFLSETLTVEARQEDGSKIIETFPVNFAPSQQPEETVVGTTIPVSNDAQIIRLLRIIFGVFAALYVGFLVIDAIIIHRAKIHRPGIHSGTHILLFGLIAALSLYANWF